ncbi:MAG: cysteine--tRNA ligase [Candidatus Pacebacteria bacterium]|nr:cysteine--tRNA ligase [Candidatus Paceibacterota bacterium]
MNLQIYNTCTKRKEIFTPLRKGNVLMYHCGPTVYWTQHIGNMRAVVLADGVVRTLMFLGYTISLVRNYTDVGHLSGDNEGDADSGEDRMEKGAKRECLSPLEIAEKYIGVYEKDIADLNVVQPRIKPRATEHIPEIIDMVQTLVNKGYAYTTDLAVYFDTSKAQNYHKLSGQNSEANIEGAGTGNVNDPSKKHPSDFALWFFRTGVHKQALQYWSSPFVSPSVEHGEGFPGWHIECSAMSKKHLGETIDIHMGGIEHVPIHHTNEIAQSEAANGVEFVHYWIHNEHLLVNDGKMSKSEGTSYSLEDVRKKGCNPLALRYFFLQSHYRSKQNFTWDALQAAQQGLDGLYRKAAALGDVSGTVSLEHEKLFTTALADDFNIPKALAITFEMLKSDLPNQDKRATLIEFDKVLGLRIKETSMSEHEKQEDIPNEVLDLAKKVHQARTDRDFKTADELRNQLQSQGYEISNTNERTLVRKKKS